MAKIDSSNWKELVIGDIFEVSRPTARKQADYEEGDVPFVASGSFNNGVQAMFKPHSKNDIDLGKCLTISPVDGYTFYQEKDFLGRGGAGSSIIILRNSNLNQYNGQYLSSILRNHFYNWTYSDMGNIDIVKDFIIKLPVDSSNEPDWKFMEDYIKNFESEVAKQIKDLDIVKNIIYRKMDISSWEEYRVGDLFTNIVSPYVYHAKDVLEDDNGIPYVVRSKFNNGIKYRVSKEEGMKTSPAGVISFGAENATFFYQSEEWCSGRDIYYIDTRNLSEYACLFIISCLMFIVDSYSYNYGLFPDLLKEERIKLPTKDGKPDYKYMEQHMRKIEKIAQTNIKEMI